MHGSMSCFVTGHSECFDKSDEHNKLCGCRGSDWPCQDGDGCLEEALVCDGSSDCRDGSDELPMVRA